MTPKQKAEHIKELLVQLYEDGKLPSDLKTLDASIFESFVEPAIGGFTLTDIKNEASKLGIAITSEEDVFSYLDKNYQLDNNDWYYLECLLIDYRDSKK